MFHSVSAKGLSKSVSVMEAYQSGFASKGSMMYVSLFNTKANNTTEHVVQPCFRGKTVSIAAHAYANYQDSILYCHKLAL